MVHISKKCLYQTELPWIYFLGLVWISIVFLVIYFHKIEDLKTELKLIIKVFTSTMIPFFSRVFMEIKIKISSLGPKRNWRITEVKFWLYLSSIWNPRWCIHCSQNDCIEIHLQVNLLIVSVILIEIHTQIAGVCLGDIHGIENREYWWDVLQTFIVLIFK